MYPNWPIPLHLTLVGLGVVVGQMFAQPLTKNRSPLTIESAAGQMIEEAALQQHLQQITGSEALAPLLLQLVGQTVANWQQQPPQQQQQPRPKYQEQQQQVQPKQQLQQATNQPQHEGGQHFFVYGNAASQQPQILAGFNGVNGRPKTLEQLQQQLQQLLPKPIQAQQQYTVESRPNIVKAPPVAAVWAPVLSNPPQLNQPLLRPQTIPSPANGAVAASCQLCCNPSEPATPTATPCPPHNVGDGGAHELVPLLSATALKAAVG